MDDLNTGRMAAAAIEHNGEYLVGYDADDEVWGSPAARKALTIKTLWTRSTGSSRRRQHTARKI